MEKELNRKLPFLDVLIDNSDTNSLLTRVYRKKTFTGLLTNYFSFTSYSYKVQWIQVECLRASVVAFVVTVELIALRGKMTDVARQE